ncbi:MAG: inverting alpha-L-rhamnosidase, partial [Capsulimonas sp.]|nr:inverting alpha-L-rhamnosidase [Capsulimonas sp.]
NLPNVKTIKRAQFVGTADNAFTLYVNGKEAGKSDDWRTPQMIDVAPLLHDGANILAVQARNNPGENLGDTNPTPAGFLGALKIEYVDGETNLFQTGSEWKSSETAGAGWNANGFEDGVWKAAMDLGAYGMQPWGDFNAAGDARYPLLPAEYLRREFTASKKIVRATAYVCGLGLFQLFVNGKPATDHMMDPVLSDFEKADYYVTTDVTHLMRNGANAVGVVIGNGRYHTPRMVEPYSSQNFGAPRVLAQIEITYSDGSQQTISSDQSWKMTDQGPIRSNNEYDGEIYDARMELSGWAEPGYIASSTLWTAPDIMPAPGGTLVAQMIEPMRVTRIVKPIKITSPKPGVYVLDMGATFYGNIRLKARGKRGDTVQITSAYALNPDGTLKTADNRSALSTDRYTFAGDGMETWNPVFRGQGLRRFQVTGFHGTPKLENFEGLDIHTDVRPVGNFSCSNDTVNKIHTAMVTGMKMFLRGAPLDPDRDERMPWEGDPAKDSESNAYNFDVAAFYTKWMQDIRRSQREDGSLPSVSMYWKLGNGLEWPSVYSIIPDWYTGFYGDTGLQQDHYEALKRWVLAMQRIHALPDGTTQGVDWGDWCDGYTIGGKIPDNGKTPLDLVASTYHYNNVRIAQRAAERFGKTDDARMWRELADGLAKAFLARFFDPATCTYTSGTQCSYVLPLAFGLAPSDPAQRQKIVDNLANDILVTHDGHLTVGLIGNQWLMQVLTDYGRGDVAWKLATQTTRPSWGYMVKSGSNTIWERWDYDTRDPGMNSEALLIQAGNVDAWFYQTLGGIHYDPKQPGFSHIVIKPHMLGDLQWVKCSFDSPKGMIVSNWTREGRNVTMNVTIPANATATVTTPDGVSREMASGRWVLKSQAK